MKTKPYLAALLLMCVFANVVKAQSAGDYKSNGTGGGTWNNAATWLTYNGTGFVAASAAPLSGTPIFVQAGDTVSINSVETLSSLTVDSSALLRITIGKTATLSGDVMINGALSISGTLFCNTNKITGKGSVSLNVNATLHIGSPKGISASDTTGNIQTAVRSFSAGATYVYTSSAAQITGDGLPADIVGTVVANNAYAASGLTISQNISVKSPGSFVVPASRVLTCKGAVAIIGSGNFILNSSATFFIGHAAGISNTAATGCIQVTGTRLFSADAAYVYNATTAQAIGNALPLPLTGVLTIANTAAAGSVLTNNMVVNTPGRVNVIGALACSIYTITGTGTFNLNGGATLLTGHSLGISATGNSGSIQTTTLNYNPLATYVYNGTIGQNTGTGLPALVANLAVSNTAAAGVKLSSNITVTNALTLSAGTLCLNGYDLTIASGKTITKQSGTISLCSGHLVYPGPINLTYSGANNITTGIEMSQASGSLSTVIVALSAGKILTLADNALVNGAVVMSSGSLALGGKSLTYAPNAYLFYNGTAAQTVSAEWPDSAFNVAVAIRNTNAAAGVVLNANKKGYTGTITVQRGGYFNSGSFLVNGSGNITISAGGTFITRHAAGLSPEGAIQLTGIRSFITGSSYTFNGTVLQETGREMPASVANLTLINTAANPVVILTNTGTGTQTITGSLVLSSGVLDLNANEMNLLFYAGNAPISRTAGGIKLSKASSLQFGAAGLSGGAAFTLPDNIFTDESPALNNLTLNRINPLKLGNQNLTLNGTLTLATGILDLANTTLTFQNSHEPISVSSGSVTAGAGASLQFGTAGNTEGAAFVLPNTFFTAPPTFKNLTVNRSNPLILTQNITLAGSLNLVNGALYIGATTLQLDSIINTTNGMLHGGPASSLTIGGTSGNLALPAIEGGLKALAIVRPNTGTTPAVTLSASLSLDSLLNLSGGSLGLKESNLALPAAATILNADEHHYIVTNASAASGGKLMRPVATEPVAFPVGTTTYTPAFIRNSADTPQVFQVWVFDGVLSGGTSGSAHQNGANAVNKTWAIEKVDRDSAAATITLQWNGEDEARGFNRTASFISKYKTTGWDTSDASTAAPLQANVYSQTWSGPLSALLFSVQKEKAALVSWLTFGAVKNGGEVDLQWTVGNAKGDQQFDVERSLNNVSFHALGTVTAANTTAGTVAYSFVDEAPVLYQTSYYRLKQTGIDGEFNYSDTVKVAADAVDGSLAYPVPVQGSLNIALQAKLGGGALVYVADAAGKLVKKQAVYLKRGSNIVVVPMQALPKGVYVVQVIADGVVYNVHKIVK